ncbi:MAG TPA: glucose-1-phosphate adenylyltransferase subunit GlgD [Ruminiclostridium sp.]|nr:glucose-1-phosphate adenylyltransferase subunit GlgD [Ruminiclostridium sp.]
MTGGVLGIIFSNMHDESVQELTSKRTMGSIPYGGRYRLVDFVLSNMYNSDITKIGVITKSNYQSLMDHLGSGKEWDLSRKRGGLYILPPFGRAQSGVYKSRLDALIGIREFIHRSQCDYIIMSDCDHICNIDYGIPLEFHIKSNADVTAVCKRREYSASNSLGSTAYISGSDGRVNDVIIEPQQDGEYNYGMNMWIVDKAFLEKVLDSARSHSFESWERDILQRGCNDIRLFSWNFDGYAGRVGTLKQFFHTNMDLLDSNVRNEVFFRYGHIYTKVRDEVPAKYGDSTAVSNSVIADGCKIEGKVENSILFRGVNVGKGAQISNCIVMQGTVIGRNVKLSYVIVDKDVFIKDNRILMGYDNYPLYIAKSSVV